MDKRNSRDCYINFNNEKKTGKKKLVLNILMFLHSFKTGYYILYYLLDVHKFKSIDFFNLFLKFAKKRNTIYL